MGKHSAGEWWSEYLNNIVDDVAVERAREADMTVDERNIYRRQRFAAQKRAREEAEAQEAVEAERRRRLALDDITVDPRSRDRLPSPPPGAEPKPGSEAFHARKEAELVRRLGLKAPAPERRYRYE